MQNTPEINSLSPEDNLKLFPSFQRYGNISCSPRALFFNMGFNSSSQNSYSKNLPLSRMKFSSSNTKNIFGCSDKINFLSNKRYFSSESLEKNNKQTNTIKKTNESALIDIKKTKASSKKNFTIPPSMSNNIISNNNSFLKNKSVYMGSIKKNLLHSLSKEIKSNTKNFNNSSKITNNTSTNKKSCNKKNQEDDYTYEYLSKTADSLDLEKMIDYIVSSTKNYKRYNENKENYNKENISENNFKNENIDNVNGYSICKCKKVGCLKYTCSCLKSGNKCYDFCGCINCQNKQNKFLKINE